MAWPVRRVYQRLWGLTNFLVFLPLLIANGRASESLVDTTLRDNGVRYRAICQRFRVGARPKVNKGGIRTHKWRKKTLDGSICGIFQSCPSQTVEMTQFFFYYPIPLKGSELESRFFFKPFPLQRSKATLKYFSRPHTKYYPISDTGEKEECM